MKHLTEADFHAHIMFNAGKLFPVINNSQAIYHNIVLIKAIGYCYPFLDSIFVGLTDGGW